MSEIAATVPIVYAGTTIYKIRSKGYLLLGKYFLVGKNCCMNIEFFLKNRFFYSITTKEYSMLRSIST
jgi:hypothetical protein